MALGAGVCELPAVTGFAATQKEPPLTLTEIHESVLEDELDLEPIDDPDCLAEQEFTYSVFRIRYSWGTIFEISFSCLADAEDRSACWALLPREHLIVDTQDTDTMGVGYNGVTTEITHRVLASEDWS